MPEILVIADDLTGAAEIGGLSLMAGLSCEILFEIEDLDSCISNVVIIDTKTRLLSPTDAAKKIALIAQKTDPEKYRLIFKKVDSLLRGPLESEIAALQVLPGLEKVLLIPANPSKRRIIKNGKYYIDDIPINHTAFRYDPWYPRDDADVRNLIIDGSDRIIQGRNNEVPLKGKIFLPDVESASDIKHWILKFSNQNTLFAGGSDLFSILLKEKLKVPVMQAEKFEIVTGPKHFILGSTSEQSKNFRKRLSQNNYALFSLPLKAIDDKSLFREWEKHIIKALENKTRIGITTPEKIVTDSEKAKNILPRLAEIARRIINHKKGGSHLFIEGGETASSFCKEMGWTSLKIAAAYDVGVVKLLHAESKKEITIKPGSYDWPESLGMYTKRKEYDT